MSKKEMLEDLERSGLTEADARKLKMQAMSRTEAAKLGIKQVAAGYLIPYFNAKGKVTKFFRYRLLEDIRSGFDKAAGKKQLKYAQAPKTLNEVYLAPFIDWAELLTDTDTALVITEGEKKAAKACKEGVPTIGLGGVWNFQASKQGVDLLEGLRQFEWKDRTVYIVFDSDASANEGVRMAAARLGDKLTQEGAHVHLGYLPSDGPKVGMDDYLLTKTTDDLREFLITLPEINSCKALHEMNNLVTYVRASPGFIYVNHSKERITPSDFKNHQFSHYSYTITREKADGSTKMETRNTAEDWLRWPHRASVDRVVYEPGLPEFVDGCINTWPGYAVEPKKGNVKPWLEMMDFMFQGAKPEDRVWFERWVAYPFQNPGVKQRVATLFWGRRKGTGKSQVGYTIMDLYGSNAIEIHDSDLENTDNDWAKDKQFVMGDEITANNNRKLANTLKSMITREKVIINIKYVPRYEVRDCINYFFTSNDADAFYMDADERRYFIHEVKGDPLPDEWYARYDQWRRSEEGKQALLHYFLTMDLGDFNPMAPAPETSAKKSMVALTRTELEAYILDLKESPDDYLARYGGGDLTTIAELTAGFNANDGKPISSVLMARKLKQAGLESIQPKGYEGNKVRLSNRDKVIFYALKNQKKWNNASADELRAHYEKHRHIQKKRSA